MFVTSNAKEADSGKLSRSWDIRIMDIRDAQKYHDVERLNAVNNAFPRGWRTSEPKQAENTITADPHRCYGRLPITRQLRKACPRLYRGQFQRHPICISTGASVGFHFRCRCQKLSGESKMSGASNFFLRLFISFILSQEDHAEVRYSINIVSVRRRNAWFRWNVRRACAKFNN